jgi:hypothetical protein
MAIAMAIIPLKIGVDFGGVLSIHSKYRSLDEDEHHSTQIDMPDAIISLIKLKEIGHRLYLISFCGNRRANETNQTILQTFPKNDLFDGIYFVRRTTYKADVCRALGCDLMIDDTLKILNNIRQLIPTMKLIWFPRGSSSEVETGKVKKKHQQSQSSDVIEVNSWCDIIKAIDEISTQETIRHETDRSVSLDDKLHRV